MLTRREAVLRTLRYISTGGFFAVAWGYMKGFGPDSLKVSFEKAPQEGEIKFKEDVYLVGIEKGPMALDNKCPHLGCKISYQAGSEKFRCPCHGSEFAIDGKRIRGPAKKNMTRLEVKSDERSGECFVTRVVS